jgi:hypothetical protein
LKEEFLGSAASGASDLVLLLEIAMGIGLVIGAWLARIKRFRQHAWCQSIIVILNAVSITLTMIPAFRVQVLPGIPQKLGRGFYGLATTHAVLGGVTEIAGLYILLAAGTRVLPPKLRLTRYKAMDANAPCALVGCADAGDGNLCAVVCSRFVPPLNLAVLSSPTPPL